MADNRWSLAMLLTVAMVFPAGTAAGAPAPDDTPAATLAAPGSIDVHCHLWGRYQGGHGGGMMPGGSRSGKATGRRLPPGVRPPQSSPVQPSNRSDYEAAARALLDQMDRYGVAQAILMPPPRTNDNLDPDEFGELAILVRNHPDRFVLAGGGDVLNPLIHACDSAAVTPAVLDRFETEAERLVAEGARAFGEMAALHLSFSLQHPFEQAPADHPLFLRLADLAARYQMPVDLHLEAVIADTDLPPAFTLHSANNTATMRATIPGLERLLAHNREARIVWQHLGWDNTGGMTVPLLRRLLAAHPNLFLALRVEERLTAMDGTPMPNRLVDAEWNLKPEWLELFAEYPDRFVIGTDEFVGVPGHSRRAPQSFEETWRILGQLPPELAAKLGRANAARIYRLAPIVEK